MSRVADALITCWEAGTVPVDLNEVRAWRAEGHEVPITWVPVTNWQGRQVPEPTIRLDVAERLAGALDDEQTRATLAAAVAEARDYGTLVARHGHGDVEIMERRAARSCHVTAARLAAEIIAAVARGDDLPEEWFRYDTYADVGEPTACEVVRLVREDLAHTSIRP